MDDREEQKHRLHNRDKSDATKIAWKRHHSSYMRGIRKRERNNMTSLYNELNQKIEAALGEALVDRDDVFDNQLEIKLENIAGGIAVSINKDTGNVSFSTSLNQSGSGMYGLANYDEQTLKQLQSELKADLLELCKTFDEGIIEIVNKHGLKSTK